MTSAIDSPLTCSVRWVTQWFVGWLILGLALLANHQDIRIPLIMAGALLSLLPILVLYVFGQKYFVRGIALTGMKG